MCIERAIYGARNASAFRLRHLVKLQVVNHRGMLAGPVGGNQNPANPSGLLYGIATLVTSSSEPSGFVAYPTNFDAFP